MYRKKIRKTLISPKVRLLLWIYMHGVENESRWLAKLADKIDYSEGSINTHLIDLLDKKLIESSNPTDEFSPPFSITDEGRNFLEPIIFTQRIGKWMGVWVGLWVIIGYVIFMNQPILVASLLLPLLVVSFVMLVVVLLFYPDFLIRFGKRSY